MSVFYLYMLKIRIKWLTFFLKNQKKISKLYIKFFFFIIINNREKLHSRKIFQQKKKNFNSTIVMKIPIYLYSFIYQYYELMQ